MNIVLNDNTPTPAPTNGCCASRSDTTASGGPVKISMQVNGTGTSTVNILNLINQTDQTCLYYIGQSGDYDGQTIQAGTWTVPVHCTTVSGSPALVECWVMRADSSGNCIATIGNITGQSTALVVGINTFSISGSQVTFNTGDVVIISFQLSSSAAGTVRIVHDQTITAPPFASSSPVGVPKIPVRSWYKRRLPIITPIPSGPLSLLPPPHQPIISRARAFFRRAVSIITPIPRQPPAAPSGKSLPPIISRPPNKPQPGRVFRNTVPAPKFTPPLVLPPIVSRPPNKPQPGRVYFARKLQPATANVAGKLLPPLVVRVARKLFGGSAWIGKVPAIPPAPVGGKVFPPIVAFRTTDRPAIRLRNSGYAVGSGLSNHYPPSPTGIPGPRLLIRGGPKGHIPFLQLRELGFATDTIQLFGSNGTNDKFLGGAAAVPSHSNAAGYPGEYSGDSSYFYFCYASNSWGRIAWTSISW